MNNFDKFFDFTWKNTKFRQRFNQALMIAFLAWEYEDPDIKKALQDNDLPSYTDFLITHFQSLGANVSELRLINNPPTIDNIRKILDNTDIIYVGGGDTLLISYIQPFEDGNKRTARTVGNALLLAADYCPLSYRSADEIEYKKGMIYFTSRTIGRISKRYLPTSSAKE